MTADPAPSAFFLLLANAEWAIWLRTSLAWIPDYLPEHYPFCNGLRILYALFAGR